MRIYSQEYNINEKQLAQLLTEQLAGLSIISIEKLGEGWDNTAYQINNELIFRVPRRKIALTLLDNEENILPRIEPFLPLSISFPTIVIQPSQYFPYKILGYKKIAGNTGCGLDLTTAEYNLCAKTLASFLKRLHSIDIERLNLNNLLPESHRIDKEKELMSKVVYLSTENLKRPC